MSLTDDIASMLTGISNVNKGSMPDAPANSVAIYLTGGYPRSLSGTELDEPTFMIRVRNTSYAAGETLCDSIKDLLHGKKTSKLLVIQQQGGVNGIGQDEQKRSNFTMNFRCYYRK